MSRGEEISGAVRTVLEEAGRIDVLICSAGISLNGMLMDTTDEEYRRVMDTNLYGTFAAIRAVMPGMFWRREDDPDGFLHLGSDRRLLRGRLLSLQGRGRSR